MKDEQFSLFASISFSIFHFIQPNQWGLDRYFAEELSFNSCEDYGLSFWSSREESYLLLAPFTEDLVYAPASQAYVARVFSVCGHLCARKRNPAIVLI